MQEVTVQEVTAPPSRRSVAFAGTGRRLVCWIVTRVICLEPVGDWFALTVTQVQGVCLTGLVGICGTGPAGLSEMKVRFLELVDRMGRWPVYGGSAMAMGEWPACGDLPKRMGKFVRRVAVWGNRDTVWKNGLRGRPQNRMGEPRYHMGRWPVWGAVESHGKPRKRMGIRGAWGSAGRGLQCMACEMWDCGLCGFL